MNDYNNNQMPTFVPSNVYEERTKKVLPSDLVLNIGVIILVLSILVAGGIYGYGRYLDKKSEEYNTAITEMSSELSKLNLKGIRIINNQSQALSDIFNNHAYPSNIFNILESKTNDQVVWTKFDMTKKDVGTTMLNLSGSAESNAVVVQQVDALKSETGMIKSVTLVKSGRNDQTLRIDFDLEVLLSPTISQTTK